MNTYLSRKLSVVSFISMLLVVFLHAYNLVIKLRSGRVVLLDKGYNYFIQEYIQGIARIAVPLFFAISGYLFFLHMQGTFAEFKEKYRKRAKTLLIPYLFWSVWSLLFCFLMQQLPPPKIFFTNIPILNFSATKFLSTIFLHPLAYQLWFLRDLIIMVIISPVLFWLLKTFRSFLLIPLFGFWLSNTDLQILSNEALLFFAGGALLALYYSHLPSRLLNLKQTVLITGIWLAILLIKLLLTYFNNPYPLLVLLLHKTGIMVGIVALWGFYDTFLERRNDRWLSLSSFSFFLYAFHEPVLMAIKSIFFYSIGKSPITFLLVFISAPLITIALGIFVAGRLKKWKPAFYGLITGGR